MPAPVVPLQTQPRASPPNWCTIFPSRRCSLSYSSTLTLLESILALMVLRCIWLRAVVWPALLPWNPSRMLIPETLCWPSCIYSCAMGSATPSFLTRTANSTAFAEKPSTFCKLIATFFEGTTTTQWWSSALIGTWPKASRSWLTNVTLSALPLRLSYFWYMLGTHALSQAWTSLVVLSQSAMSLPSPLTILQINIGSSRPPHPV